MDWGMSMNKEKMEGDFMAHDHNHDRSHEHGGGDLNTKKIVQLIIGILFFSAGLYFERAYAESPYLNTSAFVLSYLILGGEIVWLAVKNLTRGQVFDENFLMSVATIGAFIIGDYPEAVAVMLFFQVGEYFQDAAVRRSKKSITALMDIRPDYANLKIGNDIQKVAPDTVKVGDSIVVRQERKSRWTVRCWMANLCWTPAPSPVNRFPVLSKKARTFWPAASI